MDQTWNEDGHVVPVTFVQAGPVTITQKKTIEKDGYIAFQAGWDTSVKKVSRALKGHLKDLGPFRFLKEFRNAQDEDYAVGDTISVEAFVPGDKVTVVAVAKGRGFQGVVKRHGFHGGPKTHGQKDRLRAPGSIGAGGHQRVIPGRKMAGRMGNNTVTLRGVKVVQVDASNNQILLKGAIPGGNRTIISIQK